MRQEFYDEDGHLVRRMIFSDFREMDGRMIPALYTVEPLTEEKAGHRTLMRIEDMKFDVDLSRRIFTRANLERTR